MKFILMVSKNIVRTSNYKKSEENFGMLQSLSQLAETLIFQFQNVGRPVAKLMTNIVLKLPSNMKQKFFKQKLA